jgi:beta-galactosidase
MPHFYAQDGLFWLDDTPLLIQAGEFHYFRTPADQWRHRLGLLQAAGFNTLATYIPWLWHQPEPGVSDVDGHSHPMRDLAGFLDLAAGMGLWIIARPGPYIMAETINEGIPPWVLAQHPEIAFLTQHGERQNIVSYRHPAFLARVAEWYTAVFAVLTPRQVTRGGRILMVQLDNEMGMLPWVRNHLDLNPDTLARFARHVRETHRDGLAARYPGRSLKGMLRSALRNPRHARARPAVEDYRRFYRRYLRDYMNDLWSLARSQGLEVPPVVNIHGFSNGGKTFPIGLSQLIEVMALPGMISATDVYPLHLNEGNLHHILLVNALTTALHNPEQPLFSIEFQSGGNNDFSGTQMSLYDLHTRLSLAGGMRALNHYLFCDGENDPLLSPVRRHDWGHPVRKDGTLRPSYARYPRLSATLAAYGEALTRARPTPVTAVGVLLDDFMTEVNTTATESDTRLITHQRDTLLFDFIARGLALTQRAFSAIELARSELDPTPTPTLWVMVDQRCPAEIQAKLVAYMRAGGRLALVGRMPQFDRDHQPCRVLADAFEVTAIETQPPFRREDVHLFDDPAVPVDFVESYAGAFDAVFGTRQSGEVIGFSKTLGAGRGVMLGAALAAFTPADLAVFERMAALIDCPAPFALSAWADAHLSRGPLGDFLFVNHYRDDPLVTTLAYDGQPLLGGHALRLPAWRGAILPLDWRVRAGVTIHYATAEVTGVHEAGDTLSLTLDPPDFVAELSLVGYTCAQGSPLAGQRVKVVGTAGVVSLTRRT